MIHSDFHIHSEDSYDATLKLSEIAEGVGISRQGVRHVIKKGEEQLSFLEERLGLAAHNEELEKAAELIDSIKNAIESDALDKSITLSALNKIKDIIVTK